jgi:hypothetical protein
LLIYLFNPFPESGMRQLFANLRQSMQAHPRPIYVLYHNPLLQYVVSENGGFRKIKASEQYSLFSNQ